MADLLEKSALILFVTAVIFLTGAVILWFKFKILVIAGDLSGRTARKSIEDMRKQRGKQEPEWRLLEEVVLIHTAERM